MTVWRYDPTRYPETEKLRALGQKATNVIDFHFWLVVEKGFEVCVRDEHGNLRRANGSPTDEYLGIDFHAVARERIALIEALDARTKAMRESFDADRHRRSSPDCAGPQALSERSAAPADAQEMANPQAELDRTHANPLKGND